MQVLARAAVIGTVLAALTGLLLPEAAWTELGEPLPSTAPEETAEALKTHTAYSDALDVLKEIGCSKEQADILLVKVSEELVLVGASTSDADALALVFVAALILPAIVVAGVICGIVWVVAELSKSPSDKHAKPDKEQKTSADRKQAGSSICGWCGGSGCFDNTPSGQKIPCPRCGGTGKATEGSK